MNTILKSYSSLVTLSILVAASFFTLSIGAVSAQVSSEPIVIFSSGQSNMQKVKPISPSDLSPNLYVWNNDNLAMSQGTAFETAAQIVNAGVSVRFANEVAKQNPDRDVYVVNVARGGGSIERWFASSIGSGVDDLYSLTRSNVAAALANIGESEIDLFMWWQGESDRIDRRDNGLYVQAFEGVDTEFQSESWYNDTIPQIFYLLRDENASARAGHDSINEQIQYIVNSESERRLLVRTEDLDFEDDVHLSEEGMDDVAKRTMLAFEFGYKNPKSSLTVAGGTSEFPGLSFSDISSVEVTQDTGFFSNGIDFIAAVVKSVARLFITDNGIGIGSNDVKNELSVAGEQPGGYTSIDVNNNQNHQFIRVGIDANTARITYDDFDSFAIGTQAHRGHQDSTSFFTINNKGNVGIGSFSNYIKLNVQGAVKIAASGVENCNLNLEGAIEYRDSNFYGCNGIDWMLLNSTSTSTQ